MRIPLGVVLDYDSEGNLVGIDINNASTKVQLKELSLRKLPADIDGVAEQHNPAGPINSAADFPVKLRTIYEIYPIFSAYEAEI